MTQVVSSSKVDYGKIVRKSIQNFFDVSARKQDIPPVRIKKVIVKKIQGGSKI